VQSEKLQQLENAERERGRLLVSAPSPSVSNFLNTSAASGRAMSFCNACSAFSLTSPCATAARVACASSVAATMPPSTRATDSSNAEQRVSTASFTCRQSDKFQELSTDRASAKFRK
jgi:hypothetical protein